jgi:hypothetical protein
MYWIWSFHSKGGLPCSFRRTASPTILPQSDKITSWSVLRMEDPLEEFAEPPSGRIFESRPFGQLHFQLPTVYNMTFFVLQQSLQTCPASRPDS